MSIFKRSKAGLNLEFSVSEIGCLNKAREREGYLTEFRYRTKWTIDQDYELKLMQEQEEID